MQKHEKPAYDRGYRGDCTAAFVAFVCPKHTTAHFLSSHFKGWAPYVGIVFANGLFLNTFPAVWNAVSADVLPDSFNIVVSELALWDT